VATAVVDGISTRYEIRGEGPPLLMFSPGGFDATLDKWTTIASYSRVKLLHHLERRFQCIVFDRRETGESGGRVEIVTWSHYVRQGLGLLEHLGIARAHADLHEGGGNELLQVCDRNGHAAILQTCVPDNRTSAYRETFVSLSIHRLVAAALVAALALPMAARTAELKRSGFMGVQIGEGERGVAVQGFVPGGTAEAAGLRARW